MAKNEGIVRRAIMEDVKQIHQLLNYYAKEGLLLGRSISSLYDKLRDFVVCVNDDSEIVGVCALQITWDNLAEIRSLAVDAKWQGLGIGTALIESCLEEATLYGITKVFTLTYQPEFFIKHGFRYTDKSNLPHKIWSDCINCYQFPDCDETAMMLDLGKHEK